MLVADLDCFKQVNDRFGHAMGDRLLVDAGRALQEDARLGDVVARLGGDEFALLLPQTSLEGALYEQKRAAAANRGSRRRRPSSPVRSG